MSAKSGIEWTQATWNPVVGCTMKSSGCIHCWARELHDMRHRAYVAGKKVPEQYAEPFEVIQTMDDRLDMPLHWKKPKLIFVDSVSDLFHKDVPFHYIDEVFEVMRKANWHTFQVLTKRPERAVEWFDHYCQTFEGWAEKWPHNVWMGVSIEDQMNANERVPSLLKLPAWVRFLSCGPLLGPINLQKIHDKTNHVYFDVLDGARFDYGSDGFGVSAPMVERIHLVLVEGESGPKARPMHPDWARGLRDQCQANHVKFFFKQWGEWLHGSQIKSYMLGKKLHHWEDGSMSLWVGKERAGHLLDGVVWRQMPPSASPLSPKCGQDQPEFGGRR